MKLLTRIAELFSRITSAQINEKEDEEEKINYPVQPIHHMRPLICAISVGVCDKAYSSEIFASWLSSFLDKKVQTSAIETTDIFSNDEAQIYILTAFTYQIGKYIYWVQIGTWNIYKTPVDSISTKPCKCFRLMLKDKGSFQYVALCTHEKESIIINKIVLGHTYPPTDDDEETAFKCSILPCSIDKALEFVKFL